MPQRENNFPLGHFFIVQAFSFVTIDEIRFVTSLVTDKNEESARATMLIVL